MASSSIPEQVIPDIEDGIKVCNIERCKGCENQNAWLVKADLYYLAIEWSPSPTGGHFTVHGIWPVDFKGKPATEYVRPYDVRQFDEDLLRQLNEYWPDKNFGNKHSLRLHEFLKHGICMNPPYCQKTYFEMGLRMHAKVDIKSILAQGGIFPDAAVELDTDQVRKVIEQQIGFAPAVITQDIRGTKQPKTKKSKTQQVPVKKELKWILIPFDDKGELLQPFPSSNLPNKKFYWAPKY